MTTTYPHASSTFDDDDDELCPFDEVPSTKMIIEKFDKLMHDAERAPMALARNANSFPSSNGSMMTRSTTGMSSKASMNTNTTPHLNPDHDHDQGLNHHDRSLMDDDDEEMKIVSISVLSPTEDDGDTHTTTRGKGTKKAKSERRKSRNIEEEQEQEMKVSGEEILKKMYQFGSGMFQSAQSVLSPAPGVFRNHQEQQQEQQESTSAKHIPKPKEKIVSTKRTSPDEAEHIEDVTEAQDLQDEISRRRRDHHNKQRQEEESDKRYTHHIAKLKRKIACSKRLSHEEGDANNIPLNNTTADDEQRCQSSLSNASRISQAMSFGSWSLASNKKGGSRNDHDDVDREEEEGNAAGAGMVHDDVEQQLRMLDSIVESALSTSASSSSTEEQGNLSKDAADQGNEERVVHIEDGVLTRDELFGDIRAFTVTTNSKVGDDGTPTVESQSVGNSKGDDDKKSSASASVLTPEQKQKRLRRRRIETSMIYVLLFLSVFVMLYLGLKHRSRKEADEED